MLTESVNANRYWNTLKTRLRAEGAEETLRGVTQLRLQSRDNRLRATEELSDLLAIVWVGRGFVDEHGGDQEFITLAPIRDPIDDVSVVGRSNPV